MHFDSSRAWSRAIEWVRSNVVMILPLAGVFVFLPGLVFYWFTGDLQATLEAKTQSRQPEKEMYAVLGLVGQIYSLVLLLSIVQSVGTMAMTAVFADRSRPTVGEAIARGLRCLPTVIGLTLIALVGVLGLGFVLGIVIALLAGLIGVLAGAGAAAVVGGIAAAVLVGMLVWLAVRFSMVSPVVVLEGVTNPIEAMRRSWRMTGGHTGALALFFLLLGICYFVIMIIVESVTGLVTGGGAFTSPAQLGEAARIANGLVSGVLGAAAAALFTAVITASYEQLSGGGGGGTVSETFS